MLEEPGDGMQNFEVGATPRVLPPDWPLWHAGSHLLLLPGVSLVGCPTLPRWPFVVPLGCPI